MIYALLCIDDGDTKPQVRQAVVGAFLAHLPRRSPSRPAAGTYAVDLPELVDELSFSGRAQGFDACAGVSPQPQPHSHTQTQQERGGDASPSLPSSRPRACEDDRLVRLEGGAEEADLCVVVLQRLHQARVRRVRLDVQFHKYNNN